MFLYLVIVAILLFYWYGTRTFNYWKDKGIKHDKPLPYVGNNLKQFIQKSSMCMMATDVYERYKDEKVVGFYRSTSPELVIRDPAIIKRILTTDFKYFYSRGLVPHTTVIEPILQNLFFTEGDLWKLIRQRFTTTFSSGKLKAMFPIITERTEKLQDLIEKMSQREYCDVHDLMARYTTDLIGACGFGVNMDSLGDENSEFRKLGKRIFHRNLRDGLIATLKYIFPELFKNLYFISPEMETTMHRIVQSIIKARDNKPCGRNDFIDMMLELKQKGKILGESMETKNPDGTPKMVELELTDSIMTAQAFMFFAGGFETASTASSYTLHQLAFSPDYQEKVQKEIDMVLFRHNGKITYEALNEMHYLELALLESMRMYPPGGFLMRKCTANEYTIPEINLTIDKGIRVIIPIQALHRDPKYFKDPEIFYPERFIEDDSKQDNKNHLYLPFGEGPRACIAGRLGKMQSMAGLVAVLQKYSVEPATSSVRNPPPAPTGLVSEGFKGGLPLRIKLRNT